MFSAFFLNMSLLVGSSVSVIICQVSSAKPAVLSQQCVAVNNFEPKLTAAERMIENPFLNKLFVFLSVSKLKEIESLKIKMFGLGGL